MGVFCYSKNNNIKIHVHYTLLNLNCKQDSILLEEAGWVSYWIISVSYCSGAAEGGCLA
jgi:hypothetical protein